VLLDCRETLGKGFGCFFSRPQLAVGGCDCDWPALGGQADDASKALFFSPDDCSKNGLHVSPFSISCWILSLLPRQYGAFICPNLAKLSMVLMLSNCHLKF
jgi:hypothetical protein